MSLRVVTTARARACFATSAAAEGSRQQRAACELGRDLLADARERGEPVLLRPGQFDMIAHAETAPLTAPPAADAPPLSRQLGWAWSRAPRSSLLAACPDLLAQNPGAVRIATDAEIERSHTLGDPQPVTIQQYTAPVFNEAQTEALIGWGYRCPGLCGGQIIFYLRKIDGVWVRKGGWPLMFS